MAYQENPKFKICALNGCHVRFRQVNEQHIYHSARCKYFASEYKELTEENISKYAKSDRKKVETAVRKYSRSGWCLKCSAAPFLDDDGETRDLTQEEQIEMGRVWVEQGYTCEKCRETNMAESDVSECFVMASY